MICPIFKLERQPCYYKYIKRSIGNEHSISFMPGHLADAHAREIERRIK